MDRLPRDMLFHRAADRCSFAESGALTRSQGEGSISIELEYHWVNPLFETTLPEFLPTLCSTPLLFQDLKHALSQFFHTTVFTQDSVLHTHSFLFTDRNIVTIVTTDAGSERVQRILIQLASIYIKAATAQTPPQPPGSPRVRRAALQIAFPEALRADLELIRLSKLPKTTGRVQLRLCGEAVTVWAPADKPLMQTAADNTRIGVSEDERAAFCAAVKGHGLVINGSRCPAPSIRLAELLRTFLPIETARATFAPPEAVDALVESLDHGAHGFVVTTLRPLRVVGADDQLPSLLLCERDSTDARARAIYVEPLARAITIGAAVPPLARAASDFILKAVSSIFPRVLSSSFLAQEPRAAHLVLEDTASPPASERSTKNFHKTRRYGSATFFFCHSSAPPRLQAWAATQAISTSKARRLFDEAPAEPEPDEPLRRLSISFAERDVSFRDLDDFRALHGALRPFLASRLYLSDQNFPTT